MQLTEMEPKAPFVHRRHIRFGEADTAKIVYTVRFFDYALDAIDAWYESIAGASLYELNTQHDISCPFVHAELDFHAPLRPGDDVATQVLVERMGRSSLTFRLEGARADGVRCYSGRFIISFIAPSRMKSVPVPSAIADRIRSYKDRCESRAPDSLDEGVAFYAEDGEG